MLGIVKDNQITNFLNLNIKHSFEILYCSSVNK